MAQTGFEEIANCHCWDAGSLLPARLEADEIGFADVNLGCVFDNDQPIFIRNEVGQDIQQGSFPCTGSAADENVFSAADGRFEVSSHLFCDRAYANQIFDLEASRIEF